MLKILFIRTTVKFTSLIIEAPSGIMFLSSSVKKRFGSLVEVKFLDRRLDPANKNLTNILNKFNPDIVGISAMSTEAQNVYETARIAKDYNVPAVIVGGPFATMSYFKILKDENIDYVAVGEGEKSFTEFCELFVKGVEDINVAGIASRFNGKVRFTPVTPIENLDEYLPRDWDLSDLPRYFDVQKMNLITAHRRRALIDTSRGCPYDCKYCHQIFGRKVRYFSVDKIIEEIRYLYNKYGIREFNIVDDIFNLNEPRVTEFCDKIIKSGMKIRMAFPNGLKGDIISHALIDKLQEAGAYMFTFAVESASPRIQKLINKNLNFERLKNNISYATKRGVIVRVFFMLGFPTETMEEIKSTIHFASNSDIDLATFFIVIPYEGTQLYELALAECPQYADIESDNLNYYSFRGYYYMAYGNNLASIKLKAYLSFHLSKFRFIRTLIKIPNKLSFIKYSFIYAWKLQKNLIFKLADRKGKRQIER